jgi:23S rRNA (uridine2552-2'-O)-methyltransferase
MSKYVLKDTFFKKAKEEGYRARSAYKLKDIQNKFHLIKKGDKVLDLGCSPGSFLQVISDIVGYKGEVLGIDILPLAPLPKSNVSTIIRDIREIDIKELLNELSLQYFDVVTCDIAPNLSGIREVDEKNITELYEAIKNIVLDGLKTGGKFLLKSFFSGTFRDINLDLKNIFKNVTIYKPVASRSKSSEIYLVCMDKK